MLTISIIILVHQNLGAVGPVQQKIKWPSPNEHLKIVNVKMARSCYYCHFSKIIKGLELVSGLQS